jgi:hypothetical protein
MMKPTTAIATLYNRLPLLWRGALSMVAGAAALALYCLLPVDIMVVGVLLPFAAGILMAHGHGLIEEYCLASGS